MKGAHSGKSVASGNDHLFFKSIHSIEYDVSYTIPRRLRSAKDTKNPMLLYRFVDRPDESGGKRIGENWYYPNGTVWQLMTPN